MWQPLWPQLQQLRVLAPVLLFADLLSPILLVGGRWRRPVEQWRIQPQHKAALVASRLVSVVHA